MPVAIAESSNPGAGKVPEVTARAPLSLTATANRRDANAVPSSSLAGDSPSCPRSLLSGQGRHAGASAYQVKRTANWIWRGSWADLMVPKSPDGVKPLSLAALIGL